MAAPEAIAAALPTAGAVPAWIGCAVTAGRIASVRGSRLSGLSIETGSTSRTATMPQSSTFTHFGARFRHSRSTSTAAAIQLAERLMVRTREKTTSRSEPLNKAVFIVSLLSGCGRSSAGPRPAPGPTDPAAW